MRAAAQEALDTVRQGRRFGLGLYRFLRTPSDPGRGRRAFADHIANRSERFLASMDRNVWSVASSPYRALLAHAGFDPTALAHMVRSEGVESALSRLRDEGVYVTYEEYLGKVPVRRGSLELPLDPTSFHNRTIEADYLGTTGGTRSGGTPIAVSFAEKRLAADRAHVTREAHEVPEHTPAAIWLPCLPSAAGLGSILHFAGSGTPPERWFSQIPTTMDGIPRSKRLTNTMLPAVGRIARVPLPAVEHTPSDEPGPVLRWCIDALGRAGRARVSTYPSSAVALARAAISQGVELDGLLLSLVGEPATVSRRRAIEASGARTLASYAFMQAGGVGYSCPLETAESYHVDDGKVGVITRPRERLDGAVVDAFLWTTFSPTARGVFVNVENDDYGVVRRDEGCACLYGQLGSRTRVADVRGMSKVVAGGVTVPGEVFERLVDVVLPGALGGTPFDYQFAEVDRADVGGGIVLRIHPSVGEVDPARAIELISHELRRGEHGTLASEVWTPAGALSVERRAPVAARSGKTLPYEPLGVGPEAPS